jgi:hypothetical protein
MMEKSCTKLQHSPIRMYLIVLLINALNVFKKKKKKIIIFMVRHRNLYQYHI